MNRFLPRLVQILAPQSGAIHKRNKLICGLAALALLGVSSLRAALGDPSILSEPGAPGAFPLVQAGRAAELRVDERDWPGVRRAAADLQADIERVSGIKPALRSAEGSASARTPFVLIGTLGRSAAIDDLVARGKLDVRGVAGEWESFLLRVVEEPQPGAAPVLVIAGSDKRGTIYGLYELSQQIGVSPWFWWADVPVRRRAEIHIAAEGLTVGPPVVKYRGIFLNDEAPALTGWAHEKFGGYNAAFYTKVFELLLRLRANYLWPAMWNNAFNEDDPENPRLADEYGIVMGTSHHEPMMRAHQEWRRHGRGEWNYEANADELKRFWTEGMRRNRAFENIVTLGMRGDGDMPMSEESNIALLQRIVSDQREILAREVESDVTRLPQLWALYKEVQEYYERGMRVPDDITLLWCDDNWGNIRRLPTPAERNRAGGAGVYYHFDYVGGPRSYKWLNTIPITKVAEQMHLAWRYGADRIWIVNVGDLKPMEFPIEFFLSYAWHPARWRADRTDDFARAWAAREFGPEHAREIAALLAAYPKYNYRRKPELLSPETYSVVNYDESDRIDAAWRELVARAEKVRAALPREAHDAFYQLVLHPIKASATVNAIHRHAARNRLFAHQGRASTHAEAERVRALFREDAELTRFWDEDFAGGKWRHLMAQAHLGYTIWQQPAANVMPAVTEVQPARGAVLALAVEGDPDARPGDYPVSAVAKLPPLSEHGPGTRWFEVFNRGTQPVRFAVEPGAPWIKVSSTSGELGPDVRVQVSIDWSAVPADETRGKILVKAVEPQGNVLQIDVPLERTPADARGFVETDGVIAINATNYQHAHRAGGIAWRTLPDFGRGVGGMTTFPVDAAPSTPGSSAPHLAYDVYFRSTGKFTVTLECAPSLDFMPGQPLQLAVSLDDEPPQIVRLGTEATPADWNRAVAEGVRRVEVPLVVDRPGAHVLRVWRVTSAVVLERVIITTGRARPAYLGAPESPFLGDPSHF